jgi:ATP-binding cassette subfamily B (MDR/TAP) protein 1
MTLGMFIAGFAIAFNYGWLMTFVLLVSIPAIGLTGYVFMRSIQQKDQKSSKDYAEAGGLAEQALSAIKTVKMLNG